MSATKREVEGPTKLASLGEYFNICVWAKYQTVMAMNILSEWEKLYEKQQCKQWL